MNRLLPDDRPYVDYIAKTQDIEGTLKTKRLYTGNTTSEKLNKVHQEGRTILLNIDANNNVVVKGNENIVKKLKNRELTHLSMNGINGEKISFKCNIKIQTLTGKESEQLNNAVNQLLKAIQTQRESKKNEITRLDGQTAKIPQQEKVKTRQLKPSDFLVEFKKTAVTQILIQESRQKKRDEEKKAVEKDDTLSELKARLLDKENLKSEIKQSEIRFQP